MDYKDYYKILGVSRTANPNEIKTVYRRLARKYHPDVNPGDQAAEARFKEINEAYEVLADPEKRKRYDMFGSNWRRTGSFDEAFRQSGGQPANFGDFFGGAGVGFSEFFEMLFGGGPDRRTRTASFAAADVEENFEVSLAEVLVGGHRIFTVRVPSRDGSIRQRRIDVMIPPGVRDGKRLRISGEGSMRSDGSRGDLFLRVRITQDPKFERDGDDLMTDVGVELVEAMLGSEVSIPTLDDSPLTMRIPPETRAGSRLRVRGQGLPRADTGVRGDMLVRVRVQLPENLTERERDLFREMAELRAKRSVRTTVN